MTPDEPLPAADLTPRPELAPRSWEGVDTRVLELERWRVELEKRLAALESKT